MRTARINKERLNAVVRAYQRDWMPHAKAELDHFRNQPSLASAVTEAGMCRRGDGKRFDHQRRIKKVALRNATGALQRSNLSNCRTFDELHDAIEQAIGHIDGIGELTVYDTSLRIGAYLRLEPDFVYLHAGTSAGAKALGLPHRDKRLTINQIPASLRQLRPHQIEDVLCIYFK
jgi:hypothetical protein